MAVYCELGEADAQTGGRPSGAAGDVRDTSGVEGVEEGHRRQDGGQISCGMAHLLQASEKPVQEEEMLSRELYQDYTRQEVDDMFAPAAPFTPQSGTWGLHGIIAMPDRSNDFLFFVTFG